MPASLKSIAQSHADHRYWKSDLDMWSIEIANWKAEQTDALQELKRIEGEIVEHGKALDDHGKTLASLGKNLDAHEKTLATALQSGAADDLDSGLCDHHEKQATQHAYEGKAHERIKKHHHQVMAQVAMLKAAIEAAM